ncbi:hypothetical protein [Pseudoruegeria sp. SHC-113]|uniref:hypothetical protein n=1 Tax=Pseudoruegeria sp. SHC-113 TaxID=2855439 RepID=UPI0021BB31D5|nr:hypothetical protein [Pseudoruegeria sp. SHC-113]MCT8160021.1 hypothetical protein [Pseudoruegeria sp. SHC-113]
MGKTGIAIISLVVGLGVGSWGGLNLGGGAMMGVGVATGLSSGICATVQAAQEEGLLTAEQVDLVLNRAAQDISGKAELAEGEQMIGSADQCAEFMRKQQEAG